MVAEGAVGAAGVEASWPPEETLRVMIATDIHLGHAEADPERGADSFTAFEEVLELCVRYDADMLVLGGDLFDVAKPSPACLRRCAELLRQYCLGERPVAIELLSDPKENFGRPVNYEDPNLNVSCPVFSIHGNHDDPVGAGAVCSLDVLATLGLVNYWGKWSDYTRVRLSPVLLRKAGAKLALYGLGHLKDQRLSRLFQEKKVEMELPEDSAEWLNLLVLHQNRADRGPGNFISEKVLPKFLDLVVWGHEHDSEVFAMRGRAGDVCSVIQPGSTVATSLAAGEALPKHAALLQVHNKDYCLTPIPLKTVRPFIFKTIVLSEENLGEEEVNEAEKVQEFLRSRVTAAIEEAVRLRSGDPRQPTLPLVRLNVFYERESQNFNRARFGQEFVGLVANAKDVLNMKRERRVREKKPVAGSIDDEGPVLAGAALAADVEELLREYFRELPPERRLGVLSVRALTDAVKDFTLKRDEEVFKRTFEAHKRRCVDLLLKEESPDDSDAAIIERLSVIKQQLDAADGPELRRMLDEASAQPPTPGSLKRAVVVLSSDDEAESEQPLARGKGRGRGRGKAPAARGRGRAKAEPKREPSPPPARTPPERRTPRRSAAAKSAAWLQNFSEQSRQQRTYEIEDSD